MATIAAAALASVFVLASAVVKRERRQQWRRLHHQQEIQSGGSGRAADYLCTGACISKNISAPADKEKHQVSQEPIPMPTHSHFYAPGPSMASEVDEDDHDNDDGLLESPPNWLEPEQHQHHHTVQATSRAMYDLQNTGRRRVLPRARKVRYDTMMPADDVYEDIDMGDYKYRQRLTDAALSVEGEQRPERLRRDRGPIGVDPALTHLRVAPEYTCDKPNVQPRFSHMVSAPPGSGTNTSGVRRLPIKVYQHHPNSHHLPARLERAVAHDPYDADVHDSDDAMAAPDASAEQLRQPTLTLKEAHVRARAAAPEMLLDFLEPIRLEEDSPLDHALNSNNISMPINDLAPRDLLLAHNEWPLEDLPLLETTRRSARALPRVDVDRNSNNASLGRIFPRGDAGFAEPQQPWLHSKWSSQRSATMFDGLDLDDALLTETMAPEGRAAWHAPPRPRKAVSGETWRHARWSDPAGHTGQIHMEHLPPRHRAAPPDDRQRPTRARTRRAKPSSMLTESAIGETLHERPLAMEQLSAERGATAVHLHDRHDAYNEFMHSANMDAPSTRQRPHLPMQRGGVSVVGGFDTARPSSLVPPEENKRRAPNDGAPHARVGPLHDRLGVLDHVWDLPTPKQPAPWLRPNNTPATVLDARAHAQRSQDKDEWTTHTRTKRAPEVPSMPQADRTPRLDGERVGASSSPFKPKVEVPMRPQPAPVRHATAPSERVTRPRAPLVTEPLERAQVGNEWFSPLEVTTPLIQPGGRESRPEITTLTMHHPTWDWNNPMSFARPEAADQSNPHTDLLPAVTQRLADLDEPLVAEGLAGERSVPDPVKVPLPELRPMHHGSVDAANARTVPDLAALSESIVSLAEPQPGARMSPRHEPVVLDHTLTDLLPPGELPLSDETTRHKEATLSTLLAGRHAPNSSDVAVPQHDMLAELDLRSPDSAPLSIMADAARGGVGLTEPMVIDRSSTTLLAETSQVDKPSRDTTLLPQLAETATVEAPVVRDLSVLADSVMPPEKAVVPPLLGSDRNVPCVAASSPSLLLGESVPRPDSPAKQAVLLPQRSIVDVDHSPSSTMLGEFVSDESHKAGNVSGSESTSTEVAVQVPPSLLAQRIEPAPSAPILVSMPSQVNVNVDVDVDVDGAASMDSHALLGERVPLNVTATPAVPVADSQVLIRNHDSQLLHLSERVSAPVRSHLLHTDQLTARRPSWQSGLEVIEGWVRLQTPMRLGVADSDEGDHDALARASQCGLDKTLAPGSLRLPGEHSFRTDTADSPLPITRIWRDSGTVSTPLLADTAAPSRLAWSQEQETASRDNHDDLALSAHAARSQTTLLFHDEQGFFARGLAEPNTTSSSKRDVPITVTHRQSGVSTQHDDDAHESRQVTQTEYAARTDTERQARSPPRHVPVIIMDATLPNTGAEQSLAFTPERACVILEPPRLERPVLAPSLASNMQQAQYVAEAPLHFHGGLDEQLPPSKKPEHIIDLEARAPTVDDGSSVFQPRLMPVMTSERHLAKMVANLPDLITHTLMPVFELQERARKQMDPDNLAREQPRLNFPPTRRPLTASMTLSSQHGGRARVSRNKWQRDDGSGAKYDIVVMGALTDEEESSESEVERT